MRSSKGALERVGSSTGVWEIQRRSREATRRVERAAAIDVEGEEGAAAVGERRQ